MSDAEVGLTVTHRRYVSFADAHYAGNLVDGAFSLAMFGDVATEMCIRTDGDEGLFASYSDVQFKQPVRAGDLIEVTATLVRIGSRSRQLEFQLCVVARSAAADDNAGSASRSVLLTPALVATTAVGTVVVPVGQG
jgi:3-aminobutyryl-CoA ammonia-lyase